MASTSIQTVEHEDDEEEERRVSGDSARAQWLGRPFMADPEYFDFFPSEDDEEDGNDQEEWNGNSNFSPIATSANRLSPAAKEKHDVLFTPSGQQSFRRFSAYSKTPNQTSSSAKTKGRPSVSSTPRVSPLTPGVSAQKDMDKLEEQWKGLIYSKVSCFEMLM